MNDEVIDTKLFYKVINEFMDAPDRKRLNVHINGLARHTTDYILWLEMIADKYEHPDDATKALHHLHVFMDAAERLDTLRPVLKADSPFYEYILFYIQALENRIRWLQNEVNEQATVTSPITIALDEKQLDKVLRRLGHL